MKKFLRYVAYTGLFLLFLLLIGPFLVPVPPLTGLKTAPELAGPNSQFVTILFTGTTGLSLHFQQGGTGKKKFVLLHGFASNLYTWEKITPFLAERGQWWAYDRIPFGLSAKLVAGDWTADNPYTQRAAVAQFLSFLDSQNIQKAILVGNSAGGLLALQTAALHPERVEALILINPAVYTAGGPPLGPLLYTPQLTHLGPLVARQFASSDSLIELAYADPTKFTPAAKTQALIGTKMVNWDVAFWQFTVGANQDNINVLNTVQQVTIPTLVIAGEQDQIVPPAEQTQLAQALPQATLITLAACGHVPHDECPVSLAAAVAPWLDHLEEE